MNPRLTRLIAPAIATLVGFAILVGLGFWQIERLGAKQRLLARVEARMHAEPGALPPEADWGGLNAKNVDYQRVRVTGRFLHDKEAHLNGFIALPTTGPAPANTLMGFFILTPLRLADGSVVIVNRGIVPTELRDPAKRAEGQPSGDVTVTGLLRMPEHPGVFVPSNDPVKNNWFSRDPVAIGQAKGLTRVAPFVVDADATPVPGGWPRGGNTVVSFPNNHLQYAFTWFALALCLLGVFGFWARQQLKDGSA
ncbi:SURF1-like protein [Alsobacter metallidurans]|uniref:SURF1-like protein n=1 Tax=Alsobacter metallidurans TaxID=340221 RepID=A0A917I401_9HYPH|nr:SURF1 family protein [Alsobacter metallidurans]GGH12031.1 SURF1-like protein [Alsobacter metallidurans]